ncbi:MAG: dTDP-glucose 4,6-dehydratase [Armatimonadetes bacterium]|nr:dTDP-glucose 4,6-dehydratase [Armatimonadota bacterium]
MRLLVTGAAGFIGSHFVRHALAQPGVESIVVLDALRYSGNLSTMSDFRDQVIFVHGEIQDADLVGKALRDHGTTHLVNFAAESHNDRSLLSNSHFVQTNTFGVQVLLDETRKNGLERMLQVSTDEVYGSIDDGEFTEESPLQPNTPYSASKAGGELLCRAHWVSFRTPVVVTRGGNTYGAFHYPEKLIPFFLVRLLQGKKVPLYGEGSQVREWINVRDHAAGVWAVLTKGENGQVYNVGDTNERPNREVVSFLLAELGLDDSLVKCIPDPRKGAHDTRYSMATSKVRSLGWEPQVPFDEGLRQTVHWFRDNEAWWRPIVEDADYKSFVEGFYGPSLGDDL